MEDFARIEFCVMDKSGNNIEVFDRENEAIKFAQDKGYSKVLEVGYGEPDENGDEVELYATEIWNLDEDGETYEGTAYYDDHYRGVADTIETSDFAEIESWAWNMLQQGLYTEVKNYKSGKSQRLTPNDLDDNGIVIDIDESLQQEEVELDFEQLFGKALYTIIEYEGGSLESALDDMEIFNRKLRKKIADYLEWDELD